MMNHKASFLLFFAFSAVACSIGFNIDDPQKFSCDDKDDCESGYFCNTSNTCEVETPGPAKCPDADGDKYGVGPDRVNCDLCKTQSKCEEDPDDTDPFIFPNAPEECDGKDNDSDGNIDNIGTPCNSANDCAAVDPTANPGVVILCNPTSKICEATMRTTICFGADAPDPCPCNSSVLNCTDGAFPEVPAFCQ